MKRIFAVISIMLALMLAFSACGAKDEPENTDAVSQTAQEAGSESITSGDYAPFIQENSAIDHPIIKFTMENGGTFTMKLYPEYAPETVENFVSLVKSGFYDGLTFHRVIDDFMAQGGDPEGTGFGGSAKKITGEFEANGFYDNTIPHNRGVVSMARSSNNMDSASSQFFICYNGDNAASLNGNYAAFGYVFDGMETVDDFLKVERAYDSQGMKSRPVEPIVIASAEVIG